MAVISIKSFGGISPRTPTRALQDSQAQVAINCPVFAGTLNPLPDVSAAVAALGKSGTPATIYRFGQDTDSDSQYWFSWATDVDVCRGQISGDSSEWTFFTGDGIPKATYASIALSGSGYPAVSRPLGLPEPTTALTASGTAFTPNAYAGEVVLTASHISQLTTTYDIEVSITDQQSASYTTAPLTAPITATSVAAAITALPGVSAAVEGDSVIVTSDATGEAAKVYVRFRTGSKVDTTGTYTYAGYDKTGNGAADSYPAVVVEDSEIASIASGDVMRVYCDGTLRGTYTASGTISASALASALQTQVGVYLTVSATAGCVVISPGTAGATSSSVIQYTRNDDAKVITSNGSDAAIGGSVTMTQSELDAIRGNHISLLVSGVETFVFLPDTATLGSLRGIVGSAGLSVVVYGTVTPFANISTNAVGSSVSVRIRGGSYPTTADYSELSGLGYDDTPTSTETRVYTWTWVNKESGYEFESAPATASSSVDVYPTQGVTISGRSAVPIGYVVTHWRLYRSVNGIYLFVAEMPVAQTAYTDTTLAEDLSEEIPSMTWTPPPATLKGLINLPNGGMAGFVGRDVYFCDPYHPHAWPEQYIQSMDYPVVGLGRMDTTLAVLTTGTPYFLQGSHPDSITVVKSDLEQACASKRSIVSTNGVVIYASPDGLVMLSPGGSKLITEQLFTRAQWQAYFKPETIHAYTHDLKYIAFYDNGTTQGGFIFDPTSGQFIMHDIYAYAGYSDLQRDQLFTAFSDGSVKKWLGGAAKSLTWKSKKFWMPKPTGYTCAQLEAEAYPVTLKVYVDGILGHTATVADRAAFRLPVLVGRDWEFQIEGATEVFSLAIAQSMEEIAGV